MEAASLYREQVLRHGQSPRHAGRLAVPGLRGEASNPLCGDRCRVELALGDDGRIADLAHESDGCLLCRASASMMAGALIGEPPERIPALAAALAAALRGGAEALPDSLPEALAPLLGAAPFAPRHRCVLLPWQAAGEALARRTP